MGLKVCIMNLPSSGLNINYVPEYGVIGLVGFFLRLEG